MDTIPELKSFIDGLKHDISAVKNAIMFDYNNGLAEGSVTKIKLIKRIMYGRNSFTLLKAKVLMHELLYANSENAQGIIRSVFLSIRSIAIVKNFLSAAVSAFVFQVKDSEDRRKMPTAKQKRRSHIRTIQIELKLSGDSVLLSASSLSACCLQKEKIPQKRRSFSASLQ